METENKSSHSPGECRALFEKLSEYIDNELSEGTLNEIKRHMKKCDCCPACLETLKRTVAICNHVETKPVPEEFSSRLLDLVIKECGKK